MYSVLWLGFGIYWLSYCWMLLACTWAAWQTGLAHWRERTLICAPAGGVFIWIVGRMFSLMTGDRYPAAEFFILFLSWGGALLLIAVVLYRRAHTPGYAHLGDVLLFRAPLPTARRRREIAGRFPLPLVLMSVVVLLVLGVIVWRALAITLQPGAPLDRLLGRSGFLRAIGGDTRAGTLAFAPDGALLALDAYDSASEEYMIRLWRTADGALLQTLRGHSGEIARLAFAPDGQTLASSSRDGSIRLWRVADGAPLRTLDDAANADDGSNLVFTPDGQTLISGGYRDQQIRLWRVVDGTLLRTLPIERVLSLAVSPDGTLLAAGSNGFLEIVRLADSRVVQSVGSYRPGLMPLAFAPDGRSVAVAGLGSVDLWRVDDGTLLRSWPLDLDPRALAFAADGATLSVAAAEYADDAERLLVQTWRVADGKALGSRSLPTSDLFSSAAFSPAQPILAATTANETILLRVPR